jgi:glycosyltransferase involved in cell wall biosynthesis
MEPKVTVVITTLDRLGYLRQAVASVQAQEDVSRELIVVDNGSTDGTADWLRSLAGQGVVTLRVERDETLPRSARIAVARNAGLAHARGEYVWFLDDDDRLRPGSLALLASALDRHPDAVAAVGARTRFGERVAGGRVAHPLTSTVGEFGRELLLGWGFVPSQALCRAEALRRAGGWGEKVPCAEDLDMWARMLPLGPLALEPQTVVEYRVHRSQSRLADQAAGHDVVLRPYAAALVKGDGARGERLRNAGCWWDRANSAFDRGEPRAALTSTVRALILAPALVGSPLLRPLSTRMIVRSTLRCFGPTRRWVEARAQRPAAVTPRRGDGFLS